MLTVTWSEDKNMNTFKPDLNDALMRQMIINKKLEAIINLLKMTNDEIELLDL